MGHVVFRILAKRQRLRDALRSELGRPATSLYLVKELRLQISVCDFALKELNYRRAA